MKYAFKADDYDWVVLNPLVKRRTVARGPDMSIVCYEYKKGGGSLTDAHTHEHAQITHIVSGRYMFVVKGEEFEVGPGDSLYNPPFRPHTAICLEDGELLDIFTPIRADQIPEGQDLNLK